jgi:hypothetical protein
MDLSGQIKKRVKLVKVNLEITSLNNKYETNVNQDGVFRITDPADRKKLVSLLKMKGELEEQLEEA